MSKKIFIAFGVIALVSLSSCRKNRTCNCTTTIEQDGETTTQPNDIIIADVNKEEGTEKCAAYQDTTTYTGFTETITCRLNP
ncbi:MAG: hypothetical protein AB8B72_11585 [Crocinitomicaceae bacterium]